jgi:ABC-2 type transport system ATP-binding protein
MNPAPLIEAKGLSVLYGQRAALSEVTFEMGEGDRVALLGPNGAGKSTLIGVLGGALAPDLGSAKINGQSPEKFRTGARNLGWLPERAPLSPELTVLEHLRLAARLRDLGKAEERSEIERLTDKLHLEDKIHRRAGGLSSGSRRQAALATALIGRPRLLLLDEPTSGLDPDEVRRLEAVLGELSKDTTLIISTHLLREAASLTRTTAIISGGRLVAYGPWERLSKGGPPEEAYFRALSEEVL